MFEEIVRAQFRSSGLATADHINATNREEYAGACRNWAANYGVGPKPVSPKIVKAVFDASNPWRLDLVETDKPVSDLDPVSLLHKPGTDENAVGFPVGGPIPEQSGCHYVCAGYAAYIGEVVVIKGRAFKCVAPTPFSKFWRELA